jgi:hypothetical protein
MRAKNTIQTVKELKKAGFRTVPEHKNILISNTGKVYDINTGKYLKPTARNYIKPENKYLSLPKLVLLTFKGEKYRNGQIHYIDGNNKNFSPSNIQYNSIFDSKQTEPINKADLLTAIRCYFEVTRKFNITDKIKTHLYLQEITQIRHYFYKNRNKPFINLYLTYIGFDIIYKRNIAETAKLHGLPVRDCLLIVNRFTNTLINEILQDLKNGYLNIKEYKPKKPTKTDEIRKINEYLKEHGKKPFPLKKKSVKQSAKAIKGK